jgi:hypothetical protein
MKNFLVGYLIALVEGYSIIRPFHLRSGKVSLHKIHALLHNHTVPFHTIDQIHIIQAMTKQGL